MTNRWKGQSHDMVWQVEPGSVSRRGPADVTAFFVLMLMAEGKTSAPGFGTVPAFWGIRYCTSTVRILEHSRTIPTYRAQTIAASQSCKAPPRLHREVFASPS
ncbi:unnamed protein product [Tuber melanosporum]|uniref:(Perigord truffle) hypothetical protein n=1 Tax=Tuber melanosporum (strain Mel28) TaxID=656061 RepID=D5GND2_TUBMM|nr:uncharacterized protein GSTUM_00011230001 [Tuber melanosporum]CAZ86025.1 unnamed protein product [Tuber melanosporum]